MNLFVRRLLLCLVAVSSCAQNISSKDRKIAIALGHDIKLSSLYDVASGTYFQPQPVKDPGYAMVEVTNVQVHTVKIAILDSGILHAHPLLKGVTIVDKDFTGEGPEDQNGHGTSSFLLQLQEYPPYVKPAFLNVKVLDKDGRGDPELIKQGMEWAVSQGAEILGMALGAPKVLAPELCEYATKLLDADPKLLIIAAAGNDKSFEMCPAAAKGVISVGATEVEPPMTPTLTLPSTIFFVPVTSNPSAISGENRNVAVSSFQESYVAAFDKGDLVRTKELVTKSNQDAHSLARSLSIELLAANRDHICDTGIRLATLIRQISIELDDDELMSGTLYQLGIAYKCAGESPRAAVAFSRSAELYIRWGERVPAARVLNALGLLQADDEKDYQAAIETFRRTVRLGSDDQNAETDALGNICLLEFVLQKYQESLKACSDVLQKSGKRYTEFWEGRSLLEIGRIHANQNNLSQATTYLEKAKKVCSQDGDEQCLKDAALLMSEIAKQSK